jgi:hypothetical protein
MSPINPTTRHSPREPKLKEQETGECSSPRTLRQLEYIPKPEPVVKIATKKFFIKPLAFGNTEASIGSNMVLPQWRDLFNIINQEEYPEYVPHSDLHIRVLDNQVFLNIRWSYIHMVERRTTIFSCIEVLKWIVDHTNTHKFLISDDKGGCVRFFLSVEV